MGPGASARSARSAAPFGSALRKGQILDIADPRVLAHPEHPETITRDLRPEDVAPFKHEGA